MCAFVRTKSPLSTFISTLLGLVESIPLLRRFRGALLWKGLRYKECCFGCKGASCLPDPPYCSWSGLTANTGP